MDLAKEENCMSHYLLILILVWIGSCMQPNQNHYQYWQEYRSHKKLLKKNLTKTKYNILFGNLKPEQESLLKIRNNSLYLATAIDRHQKPVQSPNYQPHTTDRYFLRAEYKKGRRNGKDTYQVHRFVYIQSAQYTAEDFFLWLDELKQHISQKPSGQLQKSHVYRFLCSEFICKITTSKYYHSLSLKLHPRIRTKYQTFYETLKKRLKQSQLNIYLYSKTGHFLTLSAGGQSIVLHFRKNTSHLAQTSYLNIYSDITIKTYGLKLIIHKLKYHLSIRKKPGNLYLYGYFPKIPKYEIRGNLFYFLPQSVVNVFIPDDMATYLNRYFSLLVGDNKHKGAHFTSHTKIKNNRIQLSYRSYVEKLQKPFRPFGKEETETKGRDFIDDYFKHILKDLSVQ